MGDAAAFLCCFFFMKKNAFLVCRTMPARNATPRSTAASGLRGRLKPPRLRLQGAASVAGAGGGQGFQSPRGVSLIVQGTPMRTHTAEREGKGLADSVVQALRVLESQPPPATMAELARDNFAPSLSSHLPPDRMVACGIPRSSFKVLSRNGCHTCCFLC